LVPRELHATGQTLFAAVVGGFAGFIGNAGGGWMMSHLDPKLTYMASGMLCLAALIGIFVLRASEARSGAAVADTISKSE
jgi:predicted MFS family arabinose efflux permease